MALRLNKISLFFFAFILFADFGLAQEGKETPVYTDYKDKKQHKDFDKIRQIVSEWQIHQLKTGALVVRLKTNHIVIESLLKSGNIRMAEKKRLEQLAKNINTLKAYKKYYRFGKLYFIYTNSFDTLMNGARKHIFLDSNLVVDSGIVMRESFYLIAETDNIYNSSIGFVKESEAKLQIERGTPTLTEALVVIKNKYGHQLKHPFPYRDFEPALVRGALSEPMNAAPIINEFYANNVEDKNTYWFENEPLGLSIPKNYKLSNFVKYVAQLNADLYEYYQKTVALDLKEIDPKYKEFLY